MLDDLKIAIRGESPDKKGLIKDVSIKDKDTGHDVFLLHPDHRKGT